MEEGKEEEEEEEEEGKGDEVEEDERYSEMRCTGGVQAFRRLRFSSTCVCLCVCVCVCVFVCVCIYILRCRGGIQAFPFELIGAGEKAWWGSLADLEQER
jgi:hypothetical protein